MVWEIHYTEPGGYVPPCRCPFDKEPSMHDATLALARHRFPERLAELQATQDGVPLPTKIDALLKSKNIVITRIALFNAG